MRKEPGPISAITAIGVPEETGGGFPVTDHTGDHGVATELRRTT